LISWNLIIYYFLFENKPLCTQCDKQLSKEKAKDIYVLGACCDICEVEIGTDENDFIWHCPVHQFDICTNCF